MRFCGAKIVVLAVVLLSLAAGPLPAGMLVATFERVPAGSDVNLSTNGTLDWVHWGSFTEYAYDRKAGVAPLIGNYTALGTDQKGDVFIYQYSNNSNTYSWFDGTPDAARAPTPTGIWAYKNVNPNKPSDAVGSGFTFSVPADTTVRTLRVYAGAYNARLRFQAALSDGSSTNFNNTSLNNVGDGTSGLFTITYAANSPGQVLRITNIMAAANGSIPNVTLQAAALSYASNNNPPLVWLNTSNLLSCLCGSNALFSATALDVDGAVTNVAFFAGTNYLAQASAPPFGFVWTNAAPGMSALTAVAADNLGLSSTSSPVQVFWHTNGGSVAGSISPAVSNMVLSTAGTRDWAHWGLNDSNSFDHRAGVTQIISNFTLVGTNAAQQLTNDFTKWSWSGGTPTASASNSATAVFVNGFTNGFALTAPAGTNMRTLRLHLGASAAKGRIEARLSDFSAPVFADESLTNLYKSAFGTYAISYRAASEGQSLNLRFTATVPYDLTFGNVSLRSAAMDGLPPSVTLLTPTNGAHFHEGAPVPLSASATDPDSALITVSFRRGTNLIGQAISPPFAGAWTNAAPGSYSLTAQATDNDGNTTQSAPSAIVVDPNAPPSVILTSPTNNSSFIEGDSVTLAADAHDADGQVHHIEYYLGTVLAGMVTNPPYVLQVPNLPPAAYTVSAVAIDDNGARATSAPVSMVVVTNLPPRAEITSPLAGQKFFSPTNLLIQADATDSDGSIALVEFFSGNTKLGETGSAPFRFTWNNVGNGSYSLSVRATDNRGKSSVSTPISIIVADNLPPEASITAPANGEAFIDPVDVAISVEASDADGAVALVEFFEGTNKLGQAVSAPYSIVWSNVSQGVYWLTAVAHDNWNGVSTSARVGIEVTLPGMSNSPPEVTLLSPTNGATYIEGDLIALEAAASETNGAIFFVEFFAGTNSVGFATNSPWQLTWSNTVAGSYGITAVARDTNGISTTSSSSTIIVLTNQWPIAAITSPLDGASFVAPVNVNIEASGTDMDGRVEQISILADGQSLTSISGSSVSFVWTNAPKGLHNLIAQAVDDRGATNISAPVTIQISNSLPDVALIAPTNGQVLIVGDVITVAASATDLDGIVSEVEFFAGTDRLGISTNPPFEIVWSNGVAGTYQIYAVATDNDHATNVSGTATVTIVTNQPPLVSLLSPANMAAWFAPANITVEVESSDSDGIVRQIQVTADGTTLSLSASNHLSFVWTNASKGVHTLVAAATDDRGATNFSAPVMVFVSNTPPAISFDSPTNGGTWTKGDSIPLVVDASDPDGGIASVEFFDGTNSLGMVTNSPFSLDWTNVSLGEHSLLANATDSDGAVTSSGPVAINVLRRAPVILLANPTQNSNSFSFSFRADADWNYSVSSADAGDFTNWIVETNFAGSGTNFIFSAEPGTNNQKFYRVIAQ